MATKPPKRYTLSPDAVARLGRVVRKVEASGGSSGGGWHPYRGDDASDPILIGKTLAEWKKDEEADIVLYQDGGFPISPEQKITACLNRFADIPADRFVALAQREGGRWYVVEAEGVRSQVVVGTFKGNWNAGGGQAVTSIGSDRGVYEAVNYLFPILAGPDGMTVTIAQGLDGWFLVSINLEQLTGFERSEQQVLGHSAGGSMRWFSVTEC